MPQRNGFTLIELLVVVAIIALLISILLPALQEARHVAKVSVCASNLHQYALGLTLYASSDSQGRYPPHSSSAVYGSGNATGGFVIIWTSSAESVYQPLYPDMDKYMAMFTDMVCGGSREILWCPFDRYNRPVEEGEWWPSWPMTHPKYPDLMYYGPPAYNFGFETLMGGYMRFAGYADTWADWSQSGNTEALGPYMGGTGPQGPGKGTGARDVIVADRVTAYSPAEGAYVDYHMDYYYYPNEHAVLKRRENNVGYGDGHVEKHDQEAYIGGDGYLTWENAHYVGVNENRQMY